MSALDQMIDADAESMVPRHVTTTRTERVVVNLVLLASGAFFFAALWQAVWA